MSLADIQRRDMAFMNYRAAGYPFDEHDGDHRPELDRHALLKVAQAAQDWLAWWEFDEPRDEVEKRLVEALEAL